MVTYRWEDDAQSIARSLSSVSVGNVGPMLQQFSDFYREISEFLNIVDELKTVYEEFYLGPTMQGLKAPARDLSLVNMGDSSVFCDFVAISLLSGRMKNIVLPHKTLSIMAL